MSSLAKRCQLPKERRPAELVDLRWDQIDFEMGDAGVPKEDDTCGNHLRCAVRFFASCC
jgi:hypothetical protein